MDLAIIILLSAIVVLKTAELVLRIVQMKQSHNEESEEENVGE